MWFWDCFCARACACLCVLALVIGAWLWSCLALSRVALQLRVHFYACFCYVLLQVRVRVNKLSLYLYVMQRAVLRARSIHLFAVCYCFAHGLKGAPLSRLLLRRAACLDTFCARPGHGYQLLLHVATLRRTCAQTRAITRGSRALVSRDILTYKDTCYRPVSGAFYVQVRGIGSKLGRV